MTTNASSSVFPHHNSRKNVSTLKRTYGLYSHMVYNSIKQAAKIKFDMQMKMTFLK